MNKKTKIILSISVIIVALLIIFKIISEQEPVEAIELLKKYYTVEEYIQIPSGSEEINKMADAYSPFIKEGQWITL